MQPISLKTIFARLFDAMDRRDTVDAYVVALCAPSAQGVGTLQVNVAAGTVWVPTPGAFTAFAGGNKTPLAAVTNTHVDLLYIDTNGVLQLAAGAEAALNPVPPALPAGAAGIALIFVPVGAIDYTGVAGAYIFDIRQFNAPMFLPDGTVGAPGIRFGNQIGTGLYRTINSLNLAANGLDVLKLNAGTGVATFGPNITALSVGSPAASVGGIRLPNNSAVYARNAANTSDIDLVYLSTGDIVGIGTGSAGVQIGPTPATAGIIRIGNNQSIQARNAANSANVPLISVDGSDIMQISPNGQQVTISGNIVAPVSFLSVGTTPATGGTLRLPNNNSIRWRNAANTGDVLLFMDNTDTLAVTNVTAPALGGGAVPTLGTIGGTGPAAAAQNQWLKVFVNGAARFIPLWA